jgi:hypothetical protein
VGACKLEVDTLLGIVEVGFVVGESVVAGIRKAVDGRSSDQLDLADASWGQLVTMRRLRPNQNAWGVATQLVYGRVGVCWGVPVETGA